jgi:ribonucleoside-triphosphate reductase
MATVIEMKGEHQEFKGEVETTDMALFVRTSDEAMLGWDRQRIVDALIRETYVDFDTAKEIAREVEDLIATSKIKMITAPLIRELVDTKLVERGLEQARKMHTRLGMPLYDVDQHFNLGDLDSPAPVGSKRNRPTLRNYYIRRKRPNADMLHTRQSRPRRE